MQALRAACQSPFHRRSFRVLPISSSPTHRLLALITVALLLFSSGAHPLCWAATPQPGLQKLFHLVGIPGLHRDERVNLTLDSDGLLFQTSKVRYQVPYARIHQVLLLPADRRYEGRTYAAALATYGIGSLLILKKHPVDTAVVDYVNERGGKMGIVIQMERLQGDSLSTQLKGRGLSVVLPDDPSPSPLNTETNKSNN